MSYHYPQHVGRIVPAERANTGGMAQPASRYPRIGADGAKKILSLRRAGCHRDAGPTTGDDRLRPNLGTFIESHKARWGTNWREGSAIAGGLFVLLVTAWLIWAALAEAVLAGAGAA